MTTSLCGLNVVAERTFTIRVGQDCLDRFIGNSKPMNSTPGLHTATGNAKNNRDSVRTNFWKRITSTLANREQDSNVLSYLRYQYSRSFGMEFCVASSPI